MAVGFPRPSVTPPPRHRSTPRYAPTVGRRRVRAIPTTKATEQPAGQTESRCTLPKYLHRNPQRLTALRQRRTGSLANCTDICGAGNPPDYVAPSSSTGEGATQRRCARPSGRQQWGRWSASRSPCSSARERRNRSDEPVLDHHTQSMRGGAGDAEPLGCVGNVVTAQGPGRVAYRTHLPRTHPRPVAVMFDGIRAAPPHCGTDRDSAKSSVGSVHHRATRSPASASSCRTPSRRNLAEISVRMSSPSAMETSSFRSRR
jgi:hypothetical protein